MKSLAFFRLGGVGPAFTAHEKVTERVRNEIVDWLVTDARRNVDMPAGRKVQACSRREASGRRLSPFTAYGRTCRLRASFVIAPHRSVHCCCTGSTQATAQPMPCSGEPSCGIVSDRRTLNPVCRRYPIAATGSSARTLHLEMNARQRDTRCRCGGCHFSRLGPTRCGFGAPPATPAGDQTPPPNRSLPGTRSGRLGAVECESLVRCRPQTASPPTPVPPPHSPSPAVGPEVRRAAAFPLPARCRSWSGSRPARFRQP